MKEGLTPSAPDSVRKNRERFADRIEGNKLKRDTLFASPSAASSFLMGASTSGNRYLETPEGVTLGDLEAAELKATAGEV